MHHTVKRCFLAGFLALLLFLFTAPALYLHRVCDEWSALTLTAAAAAREGDSAAEWLQALERSYEKNSPVLKLFLDHEAVDAVGQSIGVSAPLTEQAALLSALNAVTAATEHLRALESFRLTDLF